MLTGQAPQVAVAGTRSAGGFTVVEVVIAVVLLAIVAGGLAQMSVSTSRSQLASKGDTAQAHAADTTVESLRSDPAWARTCAAACTWSVDVPEDEFTVRTTITARAVDSRSDGWGARPIADDGDRDRVIPDYYQVQVVVADPVQDRGIPFRLTTLVIPPGL